MYIPEHFTQDDREVLVDLIRQHSFGTLVSVVDGSPYATHVPFLVNDNTDGLMLTCHVARANPHWQSLDGKEALAIFQGPHAYISPTWYRSVNVPTWNYTAVHIYGRVSLVEDCNALHQIVLDLSDQYERNRDDPWIPDYDENMLNAIVGINIPVERIEGKFKISQNRNADDRDGVIEALATATSDNDMALSELMKNYRY